MTSRYDTTGRLLEQYRSPYILGFIERARSAGVEPWALAWEDESGNNFGAELVIRISLLATGQDPEGLKGWARVDALQEAEDMLRFGLKSYFDLEESYPGHLVPRMSRLHRLIQQQSDNANGLAPREVTASA